MDWQTRRCSASQTRCYLDFLQGRSVALSAAVRLKYDSLQLGGSDCPPLSQAKTCQARQEELRRALSASNSACPGISQLAVVIPTCLPTRPSTPAPATTP